MLGITLNITVNCNNCCFSQDFSQSRLFITAPTPRTEVGESAGINISCEAVDADSVAFEYLNTSGTWVSIGAGTNSAGDTWTFSSWSPTVNALAVKAIATYPDATTQEAVNSLYSLSISDTFTDTNGTAIGSHTPDDNLGAAGWVIGTGDWEVQTNALEINTADTNKHVMYHDLGYTDAIFKFNMLAFPTLASTQLILRYVDDSNYILLFIVIDGETRIIERTGGVNDTLYTSATGTIAAGDDVELWMIDDVLSIIVEGVPVHHETIANQLTGTKFGFRRAGTDDTARWDNAKIIPVAPQPTNNAVSYSIVKEGSIVFAKNQDPPRDANGIADFDIVVVGSTNYLIYATKDSVNAWDGLLYATSPVSDPHTWTVNSGYIVDSGTESVAGCSAYHDGTTWHIMYSDRTNGKLYYASGTDIDALTKNGEVKDMTGSGLFLRQSSMFLEGGTWYVYVDVRTDAAAGYFGYVGVMTGSTLATLGDPIEVLSTPGYDYDTVQLTSPSVKKNGDYYEMFYVGQQGLLSGVNSNEVGLAISKNPLGKFERVDTDPLIPRGAAAEIDDLSAGTACRMGTTAIVYYFVNGTTTGSLAGYSYVTLS